jgi:hypothetical protein
MIELGAALVSEHDHDGPAGRCARCVAEGREQAMREATERHGRLLARHHRESHVTRQTCLSCAAARGSE